MNAKARSTNCIRDLLVRLVVLVIGSGFLFMGSYTYNSTQNQIVAMLPTEGRVVDFIARTETSDDDNEEETIYYPVVEFRTFRGDVIRFEAGLAAIRRYTASVMSSRYVTTRERHSWH